MFCQECGTKNQDNAKFCFNCGAKLSDSTGSFAEKESENGEEFSIIQRRYIEKICKEIFSRYYQGKEIENAEYYENAKLYEMSAKQVDYVINRLLTVSQKVYDYIGIEVAQLGDFSIPEKVVSSIYEYGNDIGLPESSIEIIIEKYTTEHKLNEKQEMYDSLFNSYFSDYIEEDDEDNENEKDYLSELTPKEQEEVTERFNTNIEKINQLIEKEYSKTNKVDLEQKQLWGILELAHKLGFEESSDIMAIMLKYQDEHGITTEKNRQATEQFRSMVDQAYSKEIRLFGESRKLEGHLIFKNLICGNFRNQAELLKKQWGEIDSKSDSAIADMAYAIAQYGSNIIGALDSLDSTLPSLEVNTYFEDIQTYIIQKLADICAVNTVLQNIDTNTNIQALYRQARKTYRSQWMGGGFGLAGALKGAATAGVLNLGSGAIHSVANAVGNATTRYKANKQKRALIEEVKKGVPEEIQNLTEDLINNVFSYLDELYPEAFLSEDNGQEGEVYNSFLNASGDSKRALAATLLQQNPYKIKYYEEILLAYPNIKTYKSLMKIGETLGVENLSDTLHDLAVREYEIYQQHTDVNAIKSMHNWLDIRYSDMLTDKGKNDIFRDELVNQLERFTGNDLKKFINSLLEYQKVTADNKLTAVYRNRIRKIVDKNKNICAKIDTSNITEIEEKVDNLIVLKTIASEEDQKVINNLTEQFVQFKTVSIESGIDIENIDDICRRKEDIKKLLEKYGYSDGESFVTVLRKKVDTNISNGSTKESLNELKRYIIQLEKKTGIDFKSSQEKIDKLIIKKELEERTVLGVVYNTVEEANEERKKVVGSKKFESIEEAARERDRLQREKELENQEMDVIHNLESQELSEIDILKEILARNFKSKQAMDKRREYNDKILKSYISLKDKSGELGQLNFKRIIFTIIGIVAIIVAIRPFFALGWIGKIIIFLIVCLPWGWRMQVTEEIESFKKNSDILQYIESVFFIKDGIVYLKNPIRSGFENDKSDLVRVRVIAKYKDTEQGKLLSPGYIFVTTSQRAKQLVAEEVVEII